MIPPRARGSPGAWRANPSRASHAAPPFRGSPSLRRFPLRERLRRAHAPRAVGSTIAITTRAAGAELACDARAVDPRGFSARFTEDSRCVQLTTGGVRGTDGEDPAAGHHRGVAPPAAPPRRRALRARYKPSLAKLSEFGYGWKPPSNSPPPARAARKHVHAPVLASLRESVYTPRGRFNIRHFLTAV